ncbi:hepatic leukemia factor isoform X4 [Hermetia illucens]|uniref:hepatic leukemia factor isoform X4 n=1 Tax=Hermetia illucens TaxID=343691 RepID=UPI0018CC0738|nr:hepatic leukemia factor isoform X4 [Hermetia illucens]
MGSESIAHSGYFPDSATSALGNYFTQMSTNSTNSNTSASSPNSNNSPPNQWSVSGSQQQQQQQQQHQSHQPQQIHHQLQHHQQHHPLQQQRQTTSASSASSSSSSSVSSTQQDLSPQNLQLAANNHNLHLFSVNYHQQRTNPWNIPNMSAAYQRIYSENHYPNFAHHHHHNHHNSHVSSSSQPMSVNANNENNVGHQQQQNSHHKRCGNHSGKSGNSKDICGDDKFKEDGDPWNVEAQAAFLGPNLWDKTLPYDADLKVTQYADLDEFLSENNIPDGLPGTHLGHSAGLGHRSDSLGHSAGLSLSLGHVTTKRERSPSPSDCVSPDTINPPSPAESMFDISAFSFASSGRDFDPRTRAFSDEELKPQPMIKKSRKQFVPDELKDDKYWARRRKNNIAAKRSRDARRQKENQIAMRARYLEKENSTLHQEVENLKQENMELRARLSKYQEV